MCIKDRNVGFRGLPRIEKEDIDIISITYIRSIIAGLHFEVKPVARMVLGSDMHAIIIIKWWPSELL